MAKPKRERVTDNPIGRKINLVLAEMGMPGDYAALAKAFDVRVPSVYGWIDNGRIHKNKLTRLVEWSGRPLEWWLGAPSSGPHNEIPGHITAALARLANLGGQLNEKDWALLVAIAAHLANKDSAHAAQPPVSGIAEQVLARQLSTETSELISHKNTGRQPS